MSPTPGPWRAVPIPRDPARDRVDLRDAAGRTVALCLTHADAAAILAAAPWLATTPVVATP